MKIVSCLALLALTCPFGAQAQEPVPLAHGNAPGEPHHHLKIENEYIRAYYVEVPPHEATQLHQHDHDYIYVSLGPSDVMNAPLNKPEVHLLLKDGETHFTRGGFAHVARNLADTPFRNVTIELLKPQDNPRNGCERVVDGPVRNCAPDFGKLPADSPLRTLPGLGVIPKGIFQTDEIEISSYSLSLVGDYNENSRGSRLLVAEDGPTVNVGIEGESTKALRGGEAVWIETGKKWKIVLPRRNKPTRFLTIRFKDTDPAANPGVKP
jgi:quercetin dioxygenase-like cupin family protein